MLPKERVLTVLNLSQPDQVPKGELLITDGFIKSFLRKPDITWEDRVNTLQALRQDLVCVQFELSKEGEGGLPGYTVDGNRVYQRPWFNANPELIVPGRSEFMLKDIEWWTEQTDFFVFAVIDGAFGLGVRMLGFMDFISLIMTEPEKAADFVEGVTALVLQQAGEAKCRGAHGIILAEDIAFDEGPFLPLASLRGLLFPLWSKLAGEVSKLGMKILFHSDGNIMEVIPAIIEAGFSGLHSLQPSAGMDIALVKREYGRDMCLMGNMDLAIIGQKDAFYPDRGPIPGEIRATVQRTMQAAAPDGGFIFGTCAGLMEGLPIAKVMEMYRCAEEFGKY